MKNNHSYKLALSLFLTGILCTSGIAIAQTSTIQGQANPGLQLPPGAEDTQQTPKKKELKSVPSTDQEAEKEKIDVPEQAPVVQLKKQTFRADKIVIEGNTLFSNQQLSPIIQPYQGKEVSLDDLEKIVAKINNMYRDKGYLTSEAYIPPQDVDQGEVKIKIMEGKVGKLCVSGNKFYRNSAILRQLDMRQGQPFNLKNLENQLNASNQQNNFRLKATLSPGEGTGETNVRVDAAERQPWQVTPTFDNQGRPFIGNYRWGTELNNDSLLGFGDRLSGKYVGAAGTQVFLGSYFLPINRFGDEIGVIYGHSHVDVDLGIPQPDIDGIANSLGFIYSHPFDRNRTWVADVGFTGRNINTLTNSVRDSHSAIRAFQAGLNFNHYDRLGRTFARLQSTDGIAFLGGNTAYWKMEGILNRIVRLPLNNTFLLRFYGQITPNPLPSAESFQAGGAYSVRGYSEGLLIGDRGYNLTLEDRFPIPFLHRINPWLGDRLQGAAFYDVGQVFMDRSNRRYIGGVSSNAQHTFLTSVGVGLRARLTQYLQGFIDVGFGLTNRVAIEPKGQPTARIHFGLRSDLLPTNVRQWGARKDCIDVKSTNKK